MEWSSLKGLLGRSHALMLLEAFVSEHDVPAPRKLDFSVMANVQDEFEHLSEVFEQDLRLGEKTEAATYCEEEGYHSVLKSALWRLLPKDDVLAVKAVMVSDAEKERAGSWD